MQEAASVVTAWDAEALATARAVRVGGGNVVVGKG